MTYNTPWANYQQYPNFGNNPYSTMSPYGQYLPQKVAQPSPGLNGMIVQSNESITADAVPMDGSFAVFPKQDLSEIYVKSWNPDGTIRTLTFRPIENPSENADSFEAKIKMLTDKVNALEASLNKNQNGKRNYSRKENNQT